MQTFPQIKELLNSWLKTIENSLSLNAALLFKVFMKFLATFQMSFLVAVKSLLLTIQVFSVVLKPLSQQSSPTQPQFWQLQSFQITNENKRAIYLQPLNHIQCSLNAYPYSTVSLSTEARLFTTMTFQAGSQRVLRWSEKSEQNLLYCPLSKYSIALVLIKVQMSVRLEELMLPQPCQLRACALTMRQRRTVAKRSLLFISNYYKLQVQPRINNQNSQTSQTQLSFYFIKCFPALTQ